MKRIMSKEEFLSIYERQQASGLTLKDFCENEAYSSSCFHYWKKKFGLGRTYTSHPDKLPDDTFIPLDLRRRGNLPSGSGGDVTIELPSGIRIHLDSHGNPELTFELIHKLCGLFCLNDTMRYFLCPGKTDMRKGINSLCGVVHDRMGHDVRLGDVFIFINRSRTTMKLLHAEDGGMVLYVKRLEEGTFRLPAYDSRSRSYPMEWRDLVMMVEGISDNPNERLKRLKASRKDGFY